MQEKAPSGAVPTLPGDLPLRLWHLRHAAWIVVLLPWGVAGPKRPVVPKMALSRLMFRAGVIHWHLSQAVAHGRPGPP
jgi:hypothetical protein